VPMLAGALVAGLNVLKIPTVGPAELCVPSPVPSPATGPRVEVQPDEARRIKINTNTSTRSWLGGKEETAAILRLHTLHLRCFGHSTQMNT